MLEASDPDPVGGALVDRAVFMARLSDELALLWGMARGLQGALHNLPLEESDHQTRKALQSADKLTQSLECLSTAFDSVSSLPNAACDLDLTTILRGIFLEDLRDRLIHGPETIGNRDSIESGELDLF